MVTDAGKSKIFSEDTSSLHLRRDDRNVCVRRLKEIALQFECLELGLREYLQTALKLVRERVHDLLPFHYTVGELNVPLGQLHENFLKFSDDKELKDRIGDLVKRRNNVMHKAHLLVFASQLIDHPNFDGVTWAKEIEGLSTLLAEAAGCNNLLHDRIQELEKMAFSRKIVAEIGRAHV